jgi:hypothetical protein
MYSELNFLWEAWLKVFTNNKPEAIVNKVQKKGLPNTSNYGKMLCRVLPYIKAGPVDDGGVSQFRQQRVELHSGSPAESRFCGSGCQYP